MVNAIIILPTRPKIRNWQIDYRYRLPVPKAARTSTMDVLVSSTTMKRRRHSSCSTIPLSNTTHVLASDLQREERSDDNNGIIQLYSAELALLRHKRSTAVRSTRLATFDKESVLQASSSRIESATHILSESLSPFLSTSGVTQVSEEDLLRTTSTNNEWSPGIPNPVFRLLTLVSGVQFSKVTSMHSSWNEDHSVRSESFRLEGSFLLPGNKKNPINKNEPFLVCLDVEHHDAHFAANATASAFLLSRNCSIVKLRDCSIGKRKGASQPDGWILWTKEEIDQITSTSCDDKDGNKRPQAEWMALTNNFPLWLRSAQTFVEFAHDRAHWIHLWQRKYPILFGTDSNTASSAIQADSLQIWMPTGRHRRQTHTNAKGKTSSSLVSVASCMMKESMERTLLTFRWSWSAQVGKDFVQILLTSVPAQNEESLSPSNEKQSSEKAGFRSRHLEKDLAKAMLPKIRNGFQHLLQFTRGDCRQAIEMLLESLSKKNETT
jgi:hypothetical protein